MKLNFLLRALTAAASIAAGVLHWDIWAHHGYRATPIREMFAAAAVLGVALGLVALIPKSRAALPAAAASAMFLAAFALSRVGEVPTFHGGWSETGLAPTDATIIGISTTFLLLLAEAAAVAAGVASLFFSGAPRSTPLPNEFARA